MLWRQKSRNIWLKCGDTNTKFFHTSTLVRRRRNRIDSLMKSEGVWVEGKEAFKNMAVEFYLGLFKTDTSRGGSFITGQFPKLET